MARWSAWRERPGAAVTLRRSLAWTAAAIAALAAWYASGLGEGRLDRLVSNASWIAAAGVASRWLWAGARPLRGHPAYRVAVLLSGTTTCWTVANGSWAVYEIVLDRQAPSPSVADIFYTGALLLALVTLAWRLSLLVGRASLLRGVVDAGLLAGSSVWIVWWVLLRATGGPTLLWLYPMLGGVVVALALAIMTRTATGSRPAWSLVASGFFLVAAADCVWAYQAQTGGFAGGHLSDVLWPAGYLLVGLTAKAAPPIAVLRTPRTTTSWWELLLPYPPVVAALVLGSLTPDLAGWADIPLAVLVGAVVVRQILSIWENHLLARTLEARVADRTAELDQQQEHFRAIVQGISDVILVLDGDRIGEVSASATEVLGYEPEALVGRRFREMIHPEDFAVSQPKALAILELPPGAVGTASVRVLRADGSWCPTDVRVTRLTADDDWVSTLVTLRDVTEREALEQQLRAQAHQDELTGLANRRQLRATLDASLAEGRSPSLVLLDLDDFKAVNDTAGHQLGDDLLVVVADRLRRWTRPGDLVARLGGDEFAVLVTDDPEATVAASIAQRLIEDLALPSRVGGRDLRCSASAGVAAARAVGGSAEALVRDADVAMYVAKRNGKGRFERFTETMHSEVLRRHEVEDCLRAALDDDRLVLHYQPIVDLETGAVLGAEALVRLPMPDGTLLGPDDFVHVAEDAGLVGGLGASVLLRACGVAAGWQALRPDGPPLSISVNVATFQLEAGGLREAVEQALRRSDLPAHLLTLEITEGALAADHLEAERSLLAVRELGVRLSVDDFGAGHSSLARLRDMPVDELKIDRAFVAELETGTDAPMVEVILAMAERLGLAVVAEGIESPAQAAALRARGCRMAQGYLFAGPSPADAMAVWAHANFLTIRDSTSLVEPG